MIAFLKPLAKAARRFGRDETGVATLEFVLVIPVFFVMFTMTYENGMISNRHFMLERGLDLAVRDVRIGALPDISDSDVLRKEICTYAAVLPDCMNQLRLEVILRDPRSWAPITGPVDCVDRGDAGQPKEEFTNFGNNQMAIIRACIRFDPVLPGMGLGKIIAGNGGGPARGSYALVSTAAFVVEPFRRNGPGEASGAGEASTTGSTDGDS